MTDFLLVAGMEVAAGAVAYLLHPPETAQKSVCEE